MPACVRGWFDTEMAWDAMPSGKRGRQQAYSDAAIQACLTIKVLFGLPLRQATGFVESLLELVGLDWSVPDFSTLCRRQRTLSVAIPYRGSAEPLHLLVDSTGIKAEGEGALSAACCACACRVISGTHASMVAQSAASGARSTFIARQANVTFAEKGIDEETLEIRAIEVTSSSIGDAPMLPDLLKQIPPDQEISSVTAPSHACKNALPGSGWGI
jgi:Transposase DDE domain